MERRFQFFAKNDYLFQSKVIIAAFFALAITAIPRDYRYLAIIAKYFTFAITVNR
jgi:hypothetical protein